MHPAEPFSANALRICNHLMQAAACEPTRVRLECAGFAVHAVDESNLAKAEAGVTCCTIILAP